VTVKLKAIPAVAGEGTPTERRTFEAALLTVIEFEVPVIEAVTVSVAVIAWPPAAFNVAEKVPVPFVSVEFAGKEA
jgi:hypothetical protein